MRPLLLIPIAGKAQRFFDAGYTIPKQLIMADNKTLLDWSMSSIDYSNCDIVFLMRDDTASNYQLDTILKNKYPGSKVIVLSRPQHGAVFTCMEALPDLEVDRPLIINTLDVMFSPIFDLSVPDDGLILTFKANSPLYSYVKTDEKGYAVMTTEKKVISNDASVGIYCFKSTLDFIQASRIMLSDSKYLINNEYYIAPLYNILIDQGKKIKARSVDSLYLFGTPKEYTFFKDQILPKIGNKPIGLCSDHSGFQAKEIFKRLLSQNGLEYTDFGCYTSEDSDYSDYVYQTALGINDGMIDYAFGFCRSGQGINITANKIDGIRSALIYNEYSAEYAIKHNLPNFFSIASYNATLEMLSSYLKLILSNKFEGGRHQNRLMKIEEYGNKKPI